MVQMTVLWFRGDCDDREGWSVARSPCPMTSVRIRPKADWHLFRSGPTE